MSADPVTPFLDELRRAGLLPDGEAERITVSMGDGPATLSAVTEELVARNLLTQLQAELALAGKAGQCVLTGRYRLEHKIGQGGMGAVYQAHDTQLNRTVALKVLPEASLADAEAVARFRREARALAQLAHPNIIHAHDVGEDRGQHFLVMEHVDGVNLAALLRERGQVAPPRAADYAYQTALGLQHAHDKGLVHRDVKPGNLLLSRTGQVKLLDLGLARFLHDQVGDAGLTRDGTGMGTPDYMAPEQFRDARHADARADVYALGCTLYHLLAGRVPFPGSSLSEKARAHERDEPPPLAEVCPDAPAGLALAVQRMMAKRPADRFQTAAEAAEALLPYVPASSGSLPDLKRTMTWQGSRLTHRTSGRRRRWVVGAAALAAVVIASVAAGAWLVGGGEDDPGPQPVAAAPPKVDPRPVGGGEKPKPEPEKPKVVKILNGLTVAKDGTGEFKTIQEALAHAKPKMTVRVLDAADYPEALTIDEPRLEGVTLEGPKGATLLLPANNSRGVMIRDVPGFVMRGFRVRPAGPHLARSIITITGRAGGIRLEGLLIEAGPLDTAINAIHIESPAGAAHVAVQRCILTGASLGIHVEEAHDVIVSENRIGKCEEGIQVRGKVSRCLIAGNVVFNCKFAGVDLEDLHVAARDVVMVNNSIASCDQSLLRVMYTRGLPEPVAGQVAILNNVLLEPGFADITLVHAPLGPKDARFVDSSRFLKLWRFEHNRRDRIGRAAEDAAAMAPADERLETRQLLATREPAEADYLRPVADSALATAGAGKTDPGLPVWAGAVPPKGAEPWDWRWTYDALIRNTYTVSADPKDGGRFRTLGKALEAVKPGMTVEVIDAATYAELLRLDTPARHERIRLVATRGATLTLPPSSVRGLIIENVAGVTVRGFRLLGPSAAANSTAMIWVLGRCPGTVLEQLEGQAPVLGQALVVITNTPLPPQDPPILLQKCNFSGAGSGVVIAGMPKTPVAGLAIRDNRFEQLFAGIGFQGSARNVHVTGNVFKGCKFGLTLVNLHEETAGILLANNTLLENDGALGVQEETPPPGQIRKGQVAVINNVMVGSFRSEVRYTHAPDATSEPKPSDPKTLRECWRFDRNFRTNSGILAEEALPLTAAERKFNADDLLSRDSASPDYLRPRPRSALATGGVGGDDPPLPTYVGAFPPEGVAVWDWNRTWDALVRPPKTKKGD